MKTRLNRRMFASRASTLLTLLSLAATQLNAITPNVLFIAIDDQKTIMGAYGDPIAITPSIDSIASQGTTFLNAHTQWAVCGPARAALTTGLMPEETGVMGFKPIRGVLPDVITLPQHFRNNGYETAMSGKFHDNRTVGNVVDANTVTDGSQIDDPLSWSIPFQKHSSGSYSSVGKPIVDIPDEPDSSFVDWEIQEQAKGIIDDLADGNKPFFLAVGFKRPHYPLIAPKTSWDLYDPNDFVIETNVNAPLDASQYTIDMLDNNAETTGYDDIVSMPIPTAKQQEIIHAYYACTSYVDARIGEITAKLAATNDPVNPGMTYAETTIIVVWGDHGFHLGDHNKWAKHTNMEAATRIPLIIYDPRTPTTGVTTNSPAQTIDLYPTLCDLANLAQPSQPIDAVTTTGRPLAGTSLAPILTNPDATATGGALSLFSKSGGYGYAYRTQRFRYTEWVTGSYNIGGAELYDYQIDPGETMNLANNPLYADVVYQLSNNMRLENTAQNSDRIINSGAIAGSGELCTAPSAPAFTGATIVISDAYVGSEYSEDLSVDVTDTACEPLITFEKIGTTPEWVTVNLDGTLTGTPSASDLGQNTITVRATDSTSLSTEAEILITVTDGAPSSGETATFTVTADSFAQNNKPTNNFGTLIYMGMRADGLSAYARVPYLKFEVSGITGTTNNAILYVHSNNENDTIHALAVSDNTWTETGLTWDNRPATGAVLGNAQAIAGEWLAIDLGDYIDGDGTYTIALDEQGNSFHKLDSRESGFAATLEVNYTPVAAPATDTFTATEDTMAKQSNPTANFGSRTTLELRQDGNSNYARVAYLKFDITGINTVDSATLYVHSNNENDLLHALAVTDNSWSESSLTWDNRPTTGALIGSAQATAGTWVAIDVSDYITGNGTLSIALDEQGNSYHKLDSKEGGFAPYLVITHTE